MPRLALFVVSLVAVVGCSEKNAQYCPYGPNANVSGCLDGPLGTGEPCKTNNECANMAGGSLPVCDLMEKGGVCVLCTANDHAMCTGETPRCDNHACIACVDDNDCGGSGVCLQSGACADLGSIIHAVATGGSNQPCGDASNACTLPAALTSVTSTRNVIKLDDPAPATYSANGFTVASDVTIDARNAIIKRNDGGPILTINDRTVTILGGTIQGATGGSGDGILCDSNATLTVDGSTIEMSERSAIKATGGCKLTVTNAVLQNNNIKGGFIASVLSDGNSVTLSRSRLLMNRGGGIAITSGTFTIVGNVISNNGTNGTTMGSSVGGISISTSMAEPNRLDFNTIANNRVQPLTNSPGIHCSAGVFIARNNIIWNNTTDILVDQIGGTCKHSYSDIQQLSIPMANDGGNNLNKDPLFNSNYSVQKDSPVRGKADPTTPLDGIAARDMAGILRLSPADIGAYQAPAQ